MSKLKKKKKKLKELQDEKTALVEEREKLEAEAEKLQAEAEKSLAGVAVGKLLGTARSQGDRRVEAESVHTAIEELDRRIEEKEAEIVNAQDAIGWTREAQLREEARDILQACEPIVDDLEEKAQRLNEISREYHTLASGLYQRKGEQGRGNSVTARIGKFASRLSSFAGGFRKAYGKTTKHNLI